jgi:hypothetical protein
VTLQPTVAADGNTDGSVVDPVVVLDGGVGVGVLDGGVGVGVLDGGVGVGVLGVETGAATRRSTMNRYEYFVAGTAAPALE